MKAVIMVDMRGSVRAEDAFTRVTTIPTVLHAYLIFGELDMAVIVEVADNGELTEVVQDLERKVGIGNCLTHVYPVVDGREYSREDDKVVTV